MMSDTGRDLAEHWLADRWLVHHGAFVGVVTAWVASEGGVQVKLSPLDGWSPPRVARIEKCCPIRQTRSPLETEVTDDA